MSARKHEPRALPDICIVCGKRKTIPTTRYTPREHYSADPFCSRKCLERYYAEMETPA